MPVPLHWRRHLAGASTNLRWRHRRGGPGQPLPRLGGADTEYAPEGQEPAAAAAQHDAFLVPERYRAGRRGGRWRLSTTFTPPVRPSRPS